MFKYFVSMIHLCCFTMVIIFPFCGSWLVSLQLSDIVSCKSNLYSVLGVFSPVINDDLCEMAGKLC